MAIPADKAIVQICWVVNDLDEAMARWNRVSGTGPFLVMRHTQVTDPHYRGKPQATDFSVGMAQAGPIQIELIQQHDDKPSHYRDTVPMGTEAMHHVAIMPDDYDTCLTDYLAQGYAEAASGIFGDMRFSYVDTSKDIGHMIEIVEPKDSIRKFFAAVTKAAEDWDGDPATLVREL
ncbi:MAG: VOC family protein [Sphingomonadaceae bacterium]